ncbi:MAG TPA: hypothetical protein VEG33_02310, partial [Streptosporangiaceae bacterium]|nr:hypothetical protein [Streptosporangiaceae bacterium]
MDTVNGREQMGAGKPGQQVTEGVPGAAYRLGPVSALQPACQPSADRGGDCWRGAGRHRLLLPDHVAAQPVHWLAGNLAGVEQQHVQAVQAPPALLLEQRGQHGGIVDATGAVHVGGPDERRFGQRAPAVDLLAECDDVLVADGIDVRVSPPEEQPGDGPGQGAPAVPVAELPLPLVQAV